MNTQFIEKDGRPEWAVVPYADYRRLLEMAEDLADIRAADEGLAAVEAGEETLPLNLLRRLSGGENPLRVWREHRGLSVTALASGSGLDEALILRLQDGTDPIPSDLRGVLANALSIDTDDLDAWGQN